MSVYFATEQCISKLSIPLTWEEAEGYRKNEHPVLKLIELDMFFSGYDVYCRYVGATDLLIYKTAICI